jgi:hypothetical protein
MLKLVLLTSLTWSFVSFLPWMLELTRYRRNDPRAFVGTEALAGVAGVE